MKCGFACAQAKASCFASKKRSTTIAFCSAALRARSFAIHYVRPGIYGHTLRVIKDDFAAIRNFLRINSAVPFPQLNAVPSRVRARNFVFPVNGHARESWMLASERLRDQKQRDQDCRN